MIKLKDLLTEGKPRAGDYVRDKRTKELGKVNKIKGNRMAYVKFPSNKKSFLPMDVSKWKPSGKQNVGRTIWTEGLITEAYRTTPIFFRQPDKVKIDKILKKHNYPRKWPDDFFVNDYKQRYSVKPGDGVKSGNELEMSVPKADKDKFLKLFKSYGVKGRGENSKEKAARKKGSSKGRTLATWPGR